MRTMQVQVYQFSELSESAKETAREWWREAEAHDFTVEWEHYETAAKLLGIDLTEQRTNKRTGKAYTANTIQYSGFSSQGDGASFFGSFTFAPGCCGTIRAVFPKDTVLHGIADKLTALNNRIRLLHGGKLAGTITIGSHSGSYCHEYTMDATATNAVDGEELDLKISDEFRDLMRDFARWIYKGLEEDYEYRMSDEAVDESIQANQYVFDEDGDRV